MDRHGAKLAFGEHFVIANIRHRLPHYMLLWAVAVACGLCLPMLPMNQPVSSYEQLRAFYIAFMSISVTTITFAIPTCMRTVFATYEQYYSTKIKEILVERLPITLLLLSAFTTLVLSMLVVSGFLGISVEVPHQTMFYMGAFWLAVCVAYLFVAIEKLIYFIVRAPYAVLDNLELGISHVGEITDRETYVEFRRELASVNDVAATIINRSTGQDDVVTWTLDTFRNVHSSYLPNASKTAEPKRDKFHANACRSVTHEMVRMFREACQKRNEGAARSIMRTYCGMLSDAVKSSCGNGYFSEMLAQLPRMQSYAASSSVEELQSLAYTNWFFMLAHQSSGTRWKDSYLLETTRELTSGLCRATQEKLGEVSVAKFLRIASNSEIEFDMNELDSWWLSALDRSVYLYMTWLIDAMPSDADRYAGYLRKYSAVSSELFRKVLCDTPARRDAVLAFDEKPQGQCDTVADEKSLSDERTGMMLSLDVSDDAPKTLSELVLEVYSSPGMSSGERDSFLCEIRELDEGREDIVSALLPEMPGGGAGE